MSTSNPARITRRLVTLASLAFTGLVAGLLTGCTYSQHETLNASSPVAPTTTTWEFTTSTTPSSPLSIPYASIDARQTPSLHHPPSARRLQYGSVNFFNTTPANNVPHRNS
jgi:hypothetical protein